ncbi:MAG: type V CRISPR-associated protein Cas12a/Cpf1 [Bdellovibrionales bacterium]|nr:type V CRISPR-associated protein Cas12a/Cpf1 [Bdellovibrionales bacterium]
MIYNVKLKKLTNSSDVFSLFSRKYSLSKTLKFELKPTAETKQHLQDFIVSDTKRAKEYKELKKIIDEFHKDYIELTLSHKNILDKDKLTDFCKLWSDNNLLDEIKEKHNLKEKTKEEVIKKMEQQFRKDIVEQFKTLNPLLERFFKTADEEQLLGFLKKLDNKLWTKFKEKKEKALLDEYLQEPIKQKNIEKSILFSSELIKYLLPVWLKNSQLTDKEDKQKIIKNFGRFTTYLTGFNENRKNMYSVEEQGTAIAHRIINENLMKFLGNLQAYEKIKSSHPELQQSFKNMKSDFKEEFDYFSLENIEDLFKPEFFNSCLSQKEIDFYNTLLGGKTVEDGKKLQGINEYINLYRQKKKSEDIDIKIKYSNKNLPTMELLYKQILSDRESHSFILAEFENKKELLEALKSFWSVLFEEKTYQDYFHTKKKTSLWNNLHSLLTGRSYYDLEGAYFKSSELNKLSHNLFKDYRIITEALNENYDKIKVTLESYKKVLKKEDKKEFEKNIKSLKGFQTEWKKILSFEKNKEELKFSDEILASYFEFPIDKKTKKKNQKDFYSLQEIKDHIELYSKESDELKEDLDNLKKKLKDYKKDNIISSWFKYQFESKQNLDFFLQRNHEKENEDKREQNKNSLFSHIENHYQKIQNLSLDEKEFKKEEVEDIKFFLDLILHVLHLMKPFYLEGKASNLLDKGINNEIEVLYKKLKPIEKLYNQTRNYIAKKKSRYNKVKINFEDSTLLDGWDLNKEKDNLAVLLRKKDAVIGWKYYLGVMNKTTKDLFDYHIKLDDSEKVKQKKEELQDLILHRENDGNFYEKMNYKLLPDPSKMLPKVFFSKKNLDSFKPSEEIVRIRDNKTYAKNGGQDFSKADCHKFIDFYKESLKKHKEWNDFFKFNFSPTSQYNDISDFFQEVKNQGYNLQFDKIKSSYIEEKVKTGELFLFEIYSKDFSTKSKNRKNSKDNLHTIYFKGLFEKENLKDTVLKLNGKAEIFYRKATKKFNITHKKNTELENKNKNNPNKHSIFNYDLIKDKRFTEDKFFFHFPISLNFNSKGMKSYLFNQEVLKCLKGNKEVNIIGIDRGERHLAYYTIINQKREVLSQGSFNKMESSYKDNSGKEVKIEKDYHELLESKEKERDKSRKEWNKIENIKELKSGYLSYLVHKISKLMIEHKAIVIFEDLNLGFKRGRFKFEKQVYQKLEKALIDKLNYLVFKDKKSSELGGYLNAYQLTAPFESFQRMGKQTGYLFYVPAYYTSKVCPLTGFINLIYPKYKNVKESQQFFEKFDRIYFDKNKNYFVFEYQDKKVNPSKKTESIETLWKVCTHGEERYKWDVKDRKMIEVNVTENLKKLFEEHKIEYRQIADLKSTITKQEKKDFFSKLIDGLKITLQLRHINPDSKDEKEKDFILSPVADESGRFFDSRKAKEGEPKNADANGAYHIALKGLRTLENITSDKKDKLKLQAITNKDWFSFLKENSNKKIPKVG